MKLETWWNLQKMQEKERANKLGNDDTSAEDQSMLIKLVLSMNIQESQVNPTASYYRHIKKFKGFKI